MSRYIVNDENLLHFISIRIEKNKIALSVFSRRVSVRQNLSLFCSVIRNAQDLAFSGIDRCPLIMGNSGRNIQDKALVKQHSLQR